MNWQEYQEIVGKLYEQAEGIGKLYKNITRPDKITGQPRQIDAWLEIETKGINLGILIDAKFYKQKIDVKVVEEVLALADAVGASSSIIVCSNGWTDPAETRAKFSGMSLRLLTLEEAVEIIEPNKWILCPICNNDCIVLDQDGIVENNSMIFWWLAGQCRECQTARIWCQDCGSKIIIPKGENYICPCGHKWDVEEDGIYLFLNHTDENFEEDGLQSKPIPYNPNQLRFSFIESNDED